jgi:hypothetical protein
MVSRVLILLAAAVAFAVRLDHDGFAREQPIAVDPVAVDGTPVLS